MNIIHQIIRGDHQPLHELYRLYRNDFIRWGMRQFGCSDDEAQDVFQDVMIRFHQNIVSGKLTILNCHIKTYLWSIGRHLLLNLAKKNCRTVTMSTDELINNEALIDLSFDFVEQENHNAELVRRYLATLDEKSNKIISMYYLEGKNMNEIAQAVGYKNADVAKKRKYEIIKLLAGKVQGQLKSLLFI